MTAGARPRIPALSTRFEVVPARPFSLAATAERFARFPDSVDLFDGVRYRRLLPARPAALLSVAQSGRPPSAVLRVELTGPGSRSGAARAAATRLLERSLGIASDVRPFERAFRSDLLLGPAIRRFRGLRVAGAPSLWEALVLAVLAQQIHMGFAASIRQDLVHAFGRRARIAGETFYDFPSPEAIARAGARGLRGFRLSKGKRDTLLRLARAFSRGLLREKDLEERGDEEIIETLTAIRGIGRWTAEVALLRGLRRPDAFPAGDLSIVKYLAVGLLGRSAASSEREMRDLSQRWRPHRSLALVYMYAVLAAAEAGK
ncbi:MAG: hypothetical protein ABI592_05485 [Acidobacteriota bacterium]